MPVITATLSFRRPELVVSLVTKRPTLDVALDPHVLVAGIKDVRIDDQSVVDRNNRIANINLGDGLEFEDNVLNVKGGLIQRVEINNISGTLTPEQTAILDRNNENKLVFGANTYYLSRRNGDQMLYYAVDKTAQYDHIEVNLTTGIYQVLPKERTIYDDHIENNIIHITQAERLFWNDKVSCSNPEGTDLLVFTTD